TKRASALATLSALSVRLRSPGVSSRNSRLTAGGGVATWFKSTVLWLSALIRGGMNKRAFGWRRGLFRFYAVTNSSFRRWRRGIGLNASITDAGPRARWPRLPSRSGEDVAVGDARSLRAPSGAKYRVGLRPTRRRKSYGHARSAALLRFGSLVGSPR